MENKKIAESSFISNKKRLGTYFADLAIFLILTITLYSVLIVPIVSSFVPLNKFENETKQAFNDARDFLLDSHLIQLEDDNERPADETLKDDLLLFVNDDTNGKEMFSYFYLEFVPTKLTFADIKNFDVNYLNTYVFKTNDESSPFIKVSDDEVAILKEDAKINLKLYFNGEVNAASEQTYKQAMDVMASAWQDATQTLVESNEFRLLSNAYTRKSNKILITHSLSALATFSVCFFIYYALIPVFLKKGQTLGKKLLHVGVFYQNGDEIKPSTVVLRSILIFVFSLFFYLLVPVFNIGMNIVNLPIFMNGDYAVYSFSPCLVTLACASLSYFTSTRNPLHQTWHDKTLRTVVLKDSPDYIEENPVKEEF